MNFCGLSTAEGRGNEGFDRVAEKLVLRPFDFPFDKLRVRSGRTAALRYYFLKCKLVSE
jgi:hypothetical protein